jgi:hypothetical protein
MKLPFFQSTKEPLEQGQTVAIFFGRGCLGGIVLEPSKRKTKIRFLDETEEWIDNNRIRLVIDIKWKAEIERQILKK